eukprot:m.190811 g.190811  ORF g.190811 m.190811 type:complete len:590 (-) comp18138_c0_seq1:90-1859(-)
MPTFVPVVDSETPRSERDDHAATMRGHRQFDNPHQLDPTGAGAGSSKQPRSSGPTPYAGSRASKIKRRRVHVDVNERVDCGGPQRRMESAEGSVTSGGSAAAAAAAVMDPPSTDPTMGVDGWEPFGMTGLLYSNRHKLYFDTTTSTFMRTDATTGELVIVPRSGQDAEGTAAHAADAAAVGTGTGEETAATALDLTVGTETWTGRKETNEDRFVEAEPLWGGGRHGLFYAVYDGHAGTECADYLTKNLHVNVKRFLGQSGATYQPPARNENGRTAVEEQIECLTQLVECRTQQRVLADMGDDEEVVETRKQLDGLLELQLKEVEAAEDAVKEARRENTPFVSAVKEALRHGCRITDQAFLGLARQRGMMCGSTAVCAFIHGEPPDDVRLFVANVGDSRAILCRQGRAVPLTDDHKPDRPDEKRRIKRAGGHVIDAGGVARVATAAAVNGARGTMFLSVARAFGDVSLKEPDPLVISVPDIEVRHVLPGDTALVLACDGIFDVLSNQDVVDIVLKHPASPREAATAVVRAAYTAKSEDNLTVQVVDLSAWARPPLPEDPGPVGGEGGEDGEQEEEAAAVAAVDAELDIFG